VKGKTVVCRSFVVSSATILPIACPPIIRPGPQQLLGHKHELGACRRHTKVMPQIDLLTLDDELMTARASCLTSTMVTFTLKVHLSPMWVLMY
jgi:hypothetical protein